MTVPPLTVRDVPGSACSCRLLLVDVDQHTLNRPQTHARGNSRNPIAAITFELITTRMACLQASNVVTAALRGRNYMIYMHAARFERKISRTEQAETSLRCSELLPKLAKLMAVCHCLSTRITRRAVLKASLHGSQGVHVCDSGCRTLLLYRMVSTLDIP